MIWYANNNVLDYETVTDFSQLGPVDISRLNGAIPFYSLSTGTVTDFKVTDHDNCGETNGDCLKYIE